MADRRIEPAPVLEIPEVLKDTEMGFAQPVDVPDDQAKVVADLAWGKDFDEFQRDYYSYFKIIPLQDGVVLRFMDPERVSEDDALHRPHTLCTEIVIGPRLAAELVIALGAKLRDAYGTKAQ